MRKRSLKFRHVVSVIDDVCDNSVMKRSTYRGTCDHREYVMSKPIEASGLLKWQIRFIKAWNVFIGKADAFRYSAHQKQ